MLVFGPVPSRRLGRSLGINNIPPKFCSYSCVYCQVGRTQKLQVEPKSFYDPDLIAREVRNKVRETRKAGEPIDYLTFVADGEPTLDSNLGHEIDMLRSLGLNIAVITNASLVWREDVQKNLMKADWVSLKVDSVREDVWRRVNRPHGRLSLDRVLNGVIEFAGMFNGTLATETMLVQDLNVTTEDLESLGPFLNKVNPVIAYISIPTRPPAEDWVRVPDEQTVNRAYQVLSSYIPCTEYLIGYEGDAFALTGDVKQDLLSITAVHPMKQQAVREFLARAGTDWRMIDDLIARDQLVETEYENDRFYMRKVKL